MAIYVQHSTGSKELLVEAIKAGVVDGVIFSPRSDTPQTLRQSIKDMNQLEAQVLFDPLYHLCAIKKAKDANLRKYYGHYYEGARPLASFEDRARLSRDAKETLVTQETMQLSYTMSPTVYFSSFDDKWSEVSLNLASCSLQVHDESSAALPPKPLLLSFVFAEHALASKRLMDEFIDSLTRLSPAGVYLVVAREEMPYSQGFEPEFLANLMRMVHSLSRNNGFNVVCGFCDFVGILLRAVGASSFGVGFAQSSRRFIKRNFLEKPESGGQQPAFRYASLPLFDSIRLSELMKIFESDRSLFRQVLSNSRYDSLLDTPAGPQPDRWMAKYSEIQHWEALKSIDDQLVGKTDLDLRTVEGALEVAIELSDKLKAARIIDDLEGNHLLEFQRAIQIFRSSNSM